MKKFLRCMFLTLRNSGANTPTSILKYSVPSAELLVRSPNTESRTLRHRCTQTHINSLDTQTYGASRKAPNIPSKPKLKSMSRQFCSLSTQNTTHQMAKQNNKPGAMGKDRTGSGSQADTKVEVGMDQPHRRKPTSNITRQCLTWNPQSKRRRGHP